MFSLKTNICNKSKEQNLIKFSKPFWSAVKNQANPHFKLS